MKENETKLTKETIMAFELDDIFQYLDDHMDLFKRYKEELSRRFMKSRGVLMCDITRDFWREKICKAEGV